MTSCVVESSSRLARGYINGTPLALPRAAGGGKADRMGVRDEDLSNPVYRLHARLSIFFTTRAGLLLKVHSSRSEGRLRQGARDLLRSRRRKSDATRLKDPDYRCHHGTSRASSEDGPPPTAIPTGGTSRSRWTRATSDACRSRMASGRFSWVRSRAS